jgi:hypothetical protein
MRAMLRDAIHAELRSARELEQRNDLAAAFAHLERAHILSQRFALMHARVHLRMWRIGYKRRDLREMFGQTMRTIAALIFSRLWVPVGNTGGANVSAMQPMPVPEDLRELLQA